MAAYNDKSNVILLDLDGTLVDTAPDLMAALNTVLKQYERHAVTLAEVKSMIGDGLDSLVEKGFLTTGGLPDNEALNNAKSQCLDYYNRHATERSVLYPGVKETLQDLQTAGYQLVVCTNKPESAAREILSTLEIEPLLTDVVGGDTFSVRKPDPGHLLQALKRLGHANTQAVMVGDSRNDVEAARNAAIPIIFVSYGYNILPLNELALEQIINTFAELPQALASRVN